jgi:hypothetical protein
MKNSLWLVIGLGILFAAGAADAQSNRKVAQDAGNLFVSVKLHETLRIDPSNNTANITGMCGQTSFTNWNTNGDSMTSQSCGGPVCAAKTSGTATAHMRGGDIVIVEGRNTELFVPSKTPLTGEICL